MTIAPPPNVVYVLSLIGVNWPDSDEDKLSDMADAWLTLSKELAALATEVEKHANNLYTHDRGVGIDAFRGKWTAPDAPAANLRDGAQAAALIAQGLQHASQIVVAYKMKVIAEIGSLVVSTGVVIYGVFFTFGLSALGAPLLRWAAKQAIDELTERAVTYVVTGEST